MAIVFPEHLRAAMDRVERQRENSQNSVDSLLARLVDDVHKFPDEYCEPDMTRFWDEDDFFAAEYAYGEFLMDDSNVPSALNLGVTLEGGHETVVQCEFKEALVEWAMLVLRRWRKRGEALTPRGGPTTTAPVLV